MGTYYFKDSDLKIPSKLHLKFGFKIWNLNPKPVIVKTAPRNFIIFVCPIFWDILS